MASTFGVGTNPAITGPTIAPAVIPSPMPLTQPMQTNPVQQQVMEAAAGPKCNLIWVNSIDKILAHPTSPDEHMYFGDENEQIIYLRETDGQGKIKNPLKALHYTIEEVPFGPEAQFVTKDEHKQLYELVERLSVNVDSMNGKLEQLLNG